MANRRIEMYHYRQVIHRMRQGQSDRAIARSKLIGRTKCAAVRAVAAQKGWLDSGPLPDDEQLAAVFKAFGQEGIEIPYAKQDVYIKQMPSSQ